MIEISADMGEGVPDEEAIWSLIDAASVACGGHVGDESSMREAVRFASRHAVALGCHPSYPDREHFGRKSMSIPASALRASLVDQIRALQTIAGEDGLRLRHVKPHGALYNDAHHDAALAEVIVAAVRDVDTTLALIASPASQIIAVARRAGSPVIREAFADRRYRPDGSLVARSEANALLGLEESVQQAQSLVRGGVVVAADGSRVALEFETICLHSDMPGALARLQAIRAAVV